MASQQIQSYSSDWHVVEGKKSARWMANRVLNGGAIVAIALNQLSWLHLATRVTCYSASLLASVAVNWSVSAVFLPRPVRP